MRAQCLVSPVQRSRQGDSRMKGMSRLSRGFIALVLATGAVSFTYGMTQWKSHDPWQFICYFLIAILASALKVTLPGIDGTMSVNFLFVLLGVQQLGLAETLVMGCFSALVQNVCNQKVTPRPIQIFFNIFGMANAVTITYFVYNFLGQFAEKGTILLVLAASVYFLANTVPVAVVISLTEHKSLSKIWKECYFWSFPYYFLGAGVAGLVGFLNARLGWQTSLIVLPSVYVIYRSYHLYLGKLEDEKRHVEDMASLHLRTIEALALAIEAKDHTTHDHLQRVRIYALELAKDLKLNDEDMDALRAAALLHDIGKLAVPEHIINKPGRLTPEEFEKMKIHPVVGAEILEQVKFPYPVAPIVLSHHEKWDGTGYPHGLKGEEIPIGSRILAAVDCLDAMTSDRQYRKAVPTEEALRMMVADSGKHFDPKVAEVLSRRYAELEEKAANAIPEDALSPIATQFPVNRGLQPAAGFERTDGRGLRNENDFLSSIAAARQE